MKTLSSADAVTIILSGDIEHPTPSDMERIEKIRNELISKHDKGKIVHQSSKRSGYKQLTIKWVSKPRLEGET